MSLHDRDLGRKIWDGEPDALGIARKRYLESPEEQLVSYASTLYSFRSRIEARDELLRIAPALITRSKQTEKVSPAQADVLSTVLFWMWKRYCPDDSDFFWTVREVCRHGIRTAVNERGEHTLSLLRLTYAQLLGSYDFYEDYARLLTGKILRQVRADAPYIRDPNQRARVFRKLGVLMLRRGNPLGILYLARALLTRDIGKSTFRKTLFFWRW